MNKKKILLVDDEPRVTRLLRVYIENTGAYEVKEVNKGSMVLSIARQFKPDFILLDVVMPDMDGGEVAASIAADATLKNIPLVFLTATVSKEEQGIISGYPFVAKPATGRQITECIQQFLGPIAAEPTALTLVKSAFTGMRQLVLAIVAVFLFGGVYLGYRLYTRSEASQRETFEEIQKTRNEISSLRSSATQTIEAQQQAIDKQEKTLAENSAGLDKMRAINNRLEQSLKALEETTISMLSSTGVSPSMLNSIAPSVVKLYCRTNSQSDAIQKGSGFLYRASRSNTRLPLYYVQTNLHVIKMEDRSNSDCRLLVFPDYTDSNNYLLYKSRGYQSYGEDIDVAFLEPEIVNDLKAGTSNDLVVYARDELETPICESSTIGDHLSILGYPGIGGETLTVTEGIISGFELDGQNRYVKTSAKTARGNSGGVAIKDSGCLLGIPTWSRRGKVESIGRILDLNHLQTVASKYLTLR